MVTPTKHAMELHKIGRELRRKISEKREQLNSLESE